MKSLWPSRKQMRQALKTSIQEIGCGFFDGGCLPLAEALTMAIPGCRVGTIMAGKTEPEMRPDHYVVILPDGRWADGDGPCKSKEALLERYCRNERPPCLNSNAKVKIVGRKISSLEIPPNPALAKQLAKILGPNPEA
jgi:hypothetical protein